MLFNELDKIKRNAIMASIVLMFIGVLLVVLPADAFYLLNNLLGFGLLVTFVVIMLNFFSCKKVLMDYIKVVFGLIACVFGFIFLLFDDFILSTVYVLVGLIPMLLGLYGVINAIVFARTSGKKGWWILIIISVLLIIFGVWQFISPWNSTTGGTIKTIGITLMATSLVSALRLIWLWPIQSSK